MHYVISSGGYSLKLRKGQNIFTHIVSYKGNREVPIQDHIDIYYLAREMPASEKTALEAVMEADEERIKLEKLAEQLATMEDEEAQDYLMEVISVFRRLCSLNPTLKLNELVKYNYIRYFYLGI